MYFHFEWFSVILRLNAYELLAFVYIFVECTLPRQSPIAKRVLHKRRLKLIDVIDRHVMIFLTSYFGTTPMADVLFHVISYVINSVPSLRFVYGRLGDLQITAYFKGIIYVTSGTASVYFDDADNARCKSWWSCCRSQSGLLSASVVNVP